jgi:hypothetical protein
MSTRANIIVKKGDDKLFFYRHSDGYPECTMESLKTFCNMYKDQLRDNVSQSAGWLILLGAVEYGFKGDLKDPSGDNNKYEWNNWKVGAYEPTTGLHGDIEYLYIIDLDHKQLTCYEAKYRGGEVSIADCIAQGFVEGYSFLTEDEATLYRTALGIDN